MKIILSPTKTMRVDFDDICHRDLPIFLEETEKIRAELQKKSPQDLKKIWKCNDELLQLNLDRLEEMDLRHRLTPALFAYEGLSFRHISPVSFDDKMLEYAQKHLRILSGFYGILKPFDGIVSYRLEMQAKLEINQAKDLYEFWNCKLYEALDDSFIVNLASNEYSKCIENHLSEQDQMVTCKFVQEKDGKLVQKATLAKMARGEMVRFMAENNIQTKEALKNFSWHHDYSETHSTENTFVFVNNSE